jgi:hypothetical protein
MACHLSQEVTAEGTDSQGDPSPPAPKAEISPSKVTPLALAEPAPRIFVPIEAVELCVSNAYRLLADSEDLSEGSAVALTELALEETLKAWILFFHRNDMGRPRPTPPTRPVGQSSKGRTVPRKIQEAQAALILQVSKVDLVEAFSSHYPKLDLLPAILELTRQVYKYAKPKELVRQSQLMLGGIFDFTGLIDSDEIEDYLKILDVVNVERVREFALLKERGFYVNLTKEGSFLSPDSRPFPSSEFFQTFVSMLLAEIEGFIAASASDYRAPRGRDCNPATELTRGRGSA